MPWLGLFQRIYLSDTFVFFDHVQANGGKSWVSRNKILVGGSEKWLTLPVHKSGRLGQRINEVEINYETNFLSKHLNTLELNYKKTPYFEEIWPIVKSLYEEKHKLIYDFNSQFIKTVSELLGLEKQFIFSSDVVKSNPHLDNLRGNSLVLELCRTLQTKEYISGTGCLDFIQPESFKQVGIRFYFQDFQHPEYSQYKTQSFISHLSIIDALFNVGSQGTLSLISKGKLKIP